MAAHLNTTGEAARHTTACSEDTGHAALEAMGVDTHVVWMMLQAPGMKDKFPHVFATVEAAVYAFPMDVQEAKTWSVARPLFGDDSIVWCRVCGGRACEHDASACM